MSKNMSSTGHRYESAAKKFDEATAKYEKEYEKYGGEEGLKSATKYAEDQASQQSMRAGGNAGASANKAARSAGLSKAQAALMSEQAASDTTGNTYQGVYDSSRNAALNNNQATLAAAGTPLNARAQSMSAAQQEDQNAYNRSWGNVGGWGGMISGLLTSDERLKNYREVSSKIGNNKDNDYTLLKVSYKKESK